jgi:ribosomal protein S18 acetylase RimI-like enzyme
MFLTKRSSHYTARLATPSDGAAIQQQLIEGARRVHLRIPPDEVLHQLQFGLSWVTEDDNTISGLLQIEIQPFDVGFITAAALSDEGQVAPFLDACLPQVEGTVRQNGVMALVQIGYAPWLTEVLRKRGFVERDSVITYEWHYQPIAIQGSQSVTIRPAHLRDLPTLVTLDRQIFGPIWHKPASSITYALAQAFNFSVAEHNRQIVGYQWCHVNDRHGHLTRLAVRGEWQGKGVGTRLLTEAMTAMVEAGVNWVTLNTQESNIRSQMLYEHHKFRQIGERVAVLWKDLSLLSPKTP